MILPDNILKTAYTLGMIALLLTVIIWYVPVFGSDFWGRFLENWVYMVAFVLAAYWVSTLRRRTSL